MRNERKKKRILLNILLGILGISTGFFIYNLWLLTGVEIVLRYLFIALLIIIFTIYVLSSFTIKNKSKPKKAFYYIFMIILIISQAILGYYVNKFYSTLDNMSKNTIVYSTSIVTLNTSNVKSATDLKDLKIGMINDTSSVEGYTIAKTMITENKLTSNNTITEYDDYYTLLDDLYAKKIDAAFLPTEYVSMFKSSESFANIETETKIIISKTKEVKKKITTTTKKKLTEPFTVLLMGIDSTASDIKTASSNGDSLMVVTFNPETLNATIVSIPRDTYVPIACFPNQKKNKITHAGWHGEECMEETIENFTDIDIDYYVKVDFKGVVDLVELLDGITVNVPMNFCEQNSARSYKNQICLKTGVQTLNGEAALALARHRHTLATGDFQRGLNQQLVVEGILKKLKTVRNVNQFYDLLNAMSNHMDTNLSTSQILSLYNVGKDIVASGTSNGESVVLLQQLFLQEASMMIYDASFGQALSDALYYPKSLEAVTNAMKVNLGLKEPELIKVFSFSINEVYEKEIIGKGITGSLNIDLVPNFTGEAKTYVASWASKRGISVTYKYIDKDSTYTQDDVVSQSVHSQTDVSTISSMTITLANIVAASDEEEEEEPTGTIYICTETSLEINQATYDGLTKTKLDGTPCNDQTDFTIKTA